MFRSSKIAVGMKHITKCLYRSNMKYASFSTHLVVAPIITNQYNNNSNMNNFKFLFRIGMGLVVGVALSTSTSAYCEENTDKSIENVNTVNKNIEKENLAKWASSATRK